MRIRDPGSGISVPADHTLVKQVLVNLVSNGIKYGGGTDVVLSYRYASGQHEFRVADKGPGIALEDHGRVVERFTRLDSESWAEGVGLGLAVSREIVLAMGGTLVLESSPGQGAAFTVALPASGRRRSDHPSEPAD